MKLRIIILFVSLLTAGSCREISKPSDKIIVVQPFSDFEPSLTEKLYKQIKKIIPGSIIMMPIELPHQAFYPPRNRYRADTLIRYLSRPGSSDTIVIGLTSKDISTQKDDINDWGIMGLGYCPGKACVVSTFRLAKANQAAQFYKLAMHELGHTQGLPHCLNKTCFMRDAAGGNPLNEETGFCNSCKSYLKRRGWQFN